VGRITQVRNHSAGQPATWQEFQLIEWIRRHAGKQRKKNELGIGDDASAYRPQLHTIELVTCDALIEGVHWSFAWCDPESLGKKAAAVNLSDIAAMGGSPERAYLILALPRRLSKEMIHRLLKALVKSLNYYNTDLVGGDTVFSPGPMMLALTLQGAVLRREMVLRSSARPGDLLLVTGTLGAAAAGLELVRRYQKVPSQFRSVVKRLLAPVPRLKQGRILAASGRVHAMLDISDGLAGDVRRLAKASGVGVRLWANKLPLSRSVRLAAQTLNQDPLNFALRGGEDYELLFTTPAQYAPDLIKLLQVQTRTSCSIIGEIVPACQGMQVILPDGRQCNLPAAWEHSAVNLYSGLKRKVK